MKKAQSEVITTVLIILLVLAAVFIVYTAVRGMVSSSVTTAEQKAKCIGLDMKVTSVSHKSEAAHCSDSTKITAATCVAPATWIIPAAVITVERNSGGNAEGATPVVLVKGKRVTASCIVSGETEPRPITELETTTCTLTGTVLEPGDQITVGGMYGTIVCEGVSAEFPVPTTAVI